MSSILARFLPIAEFAPFFDWKGVDSSPGGVHTIALPPNNFLFAVVVFPLLVVNPSIHTPLSNGLLIGFLISIFERE